MKQGKHKRVKKLNIETNGKHWATTKEGREYLSSVLKGKIVSQEARNNMRISAASRVRNKKETLFSFGRGGFRKDLNLYFRSSWEANTARIMNHLNVSWKYEPKTFIFPDGTTYTPDFCIFEDQYIEVKGRFDKKSIDKINNFKLYYPEISLAIIGESCYKYMRKTFKEKIQFWEK